MNISFCSKPICGQNGVFLFFIQHWGEKHQGLAVTGPNETNQQNENIILHKHVSKKNLDKPFLAFIVS